MSARLAKLLQVRGHRLKAEWLRRLRTKPPKTALSHADILIHRMDDTIGELALMIKGQAFPSAFVSNVTLQGKLRKICRCGLNPLLDYFLTGELVLLTVLPKLTDAEKVSLKKAWHAIAQRDVENLCGACCRNKEDTPESVHSDDQCCGVETTRAR